jgi:MGT family glycosyltransferase
MKHQKVVYISLGTINTNFQEFYQKCMDSLENTDISVIMSVGKKINISSFNRIPDNFIIKNYVPQLEILKRCNIFISHGGFNSVSEALYYGVPVIVIPLTNDQFMTAQHIEKIGAGKTLKMNNITTVDIRNTVYDIMADKQYYENCSQIRDSFHNAGGYKKAADYIQHFLQERVAMQ